MSSWFRRLTANLQGLNRWNCLRANKVFDSLKLTCFQKRSGECWSFFGRLRAHSWHSAALLARDLNRGSCPMFWSCRGFMEIQFEGWFLAMSRSMAKIRTGEKCSLDFISFDSSLILLSCCFCFTCTKIANSFHKNLFFNVFSWLAFGFAFFVGLTYTCFQKSTKTNDHDEANKKSKVHTFQ